MLTPSTPGIIAGFGKIEEYETSEDWAEYVERLEYYFSANDIVDDKKRSVLLTVCGKTTYKLIRSLLAPAKPDTKTYKEIVDIVKAHQCPKPSVIVKMFEA